jgi:hypothetical protein
VTYSAEISRSNPTCFVFLVDQSASMIDPIGGSEVPQKKADVVADAINRLLTELAVKCAKEEGVRDYFTSPLSATVNLLNPRFGARWPDVTSYPLVKSLTTQPR